MGIITHLTSFLTSPYQSLSVPISPYQILDPKSTYSLVLHDRKLTKVSHKLTHITQLLDKNPYSLRFPRNRSIRLFDLSHRSDSSIFPTHILLDLLEGQWSRSGIKMGKFREYLGMNKKLEIRKIWDNGKYFKL